MEFVRTGENGDAVFALDEHDLVTIPALTWHQFRADGDAPLGFLCLVNAERDKPQLPTAEARIKEKAGRLMVLEVAASTRVGVYARV